MDLFRRKVPDTETRSSGTGYTAAIMAAREAYISGASGLAELTATAQTCVSLWEGGLSLADVTGTDLLTPSRLARTARSLALRGEAVWLIDDMGLIPASDWEVSTRNGEPRAYRLSIPDAGGGATRTALAAEVLHFRASVDVSTPWAGSAPLSRARLTAGMLNALELALGEVYDNAPLGSQVVPFPESPETDLETLARRFRGSRGRVLLRESVNVTAAGGPAPVQDWAPRNLTPDLSGAMTKESLDAARNGILAAFGVLPGMLSPSVTRPMVREAQRHLAQWALQPLAALIAEEASTKLGAEVALDTMRPLQAFDAGGRARALSTIVGALAAAKEAGVDPAQALKLVDWQE
ncbi:phage portal protein [Salipiger sp. HF18]|uniref:phage portal protein n=1 Tax=Salipiger sp. HF18 TaxID=2721557 RepID=UPI0034C618DB